MAAGDSWAWEEKGCASAGGGLGRGVGDKGDPAARQGGAGPPWSWLSAVLTPRQPGPLGTAPSHRLGAGLGSGVQGLGVQDESGASLSTAALGLGAKQLAPRPPESPGSFPVTAGSAARAIYNSHSRLCSAVALPGEPGEGQPTAGSLGPGYEALT